MGHGPRRRLCLVALLLLVLAGAAADASGCGNTKDSIVGTGIVTSTFSSRRLGYSFRYPERCVYMSPTPAAGTSPGLVQQVIVADPSGMVVKGTALDAFTVEVYRLRPAAAPGDVAAHKREFEQKTMSLIGRPTGFAMARAPDVAAFAGQAAIECEYFFHVRGERVGMLAYLVPKGRYAYWIRLQSSRKTMGTSPMVVTLASFAFD